MSDDMERLLQHYRTTTAEIFYYLPDYPRLLQSYIWQDHDLPPQFPELKKFLNFWEHSLEGKLHSITVTSCDLIKPSEYRFCRGELLLH